MARTGRSGSRAQKDAEACGVAAPVSAARTPDSLPAAYIALCRDVRTLVYRPPGRHGATVRRALRGIGLAWLGRVPRVGETPGVVLHLAGVLRSLLVQHAAGMPAGGAQPPVPWRDVVLRVDAALSELEASDPLGVRLIELRYFAGLDPVAAARMAGVEPEAGRRVFRAARAWVLGRLGRSAPAGSTVTLQFGP